MKRVCTGKGMCILWALFYILYYNKGIKKQRDSSKSKVTFNSKLKHNRNISSNILIFTSIEI